MRKEQQARNIGIQVPLPTKMCDDIHCPFHSSMSLRGRIIEGTIIRNIFHKTAVLELSRLFYIPKFERYEKRVSRIKAHVPPCIDVDKGDFVRIMETRKISKTKSFVVIEVKKK